MAASMAHAAKSSSAPPPYSSQDSTVELAVKEVGVFQQMPPLPGHLHWWASRAYDFPLFTPAIPACTNHPVSQAQSEGLLSSAGLIVTRQ